MADDAEKKKTAAEREEEILRFWNENSIFKKSLEFRKDAEEFVFYDGPPFATGLPHYGHVLTSVLKDVLPRYQTMCGKHVPRRWGWDCHGLPVENLVEQELGLLHKKDIENYGIAKFNKEAERSVLRYAEDWKTIIPRIGRWVDMEQDYRTMDWTYTESVWWVFKTLHEKGLVYEGYKSMHICPRCETPLANFEVSQGYKDITDISATAKFELADTPGTFVLAWTTTPWTLPGNVALAVGKDIDYSEIEVTNEEGIRRYVVATDSLNKVFEKDFVIENLVVGEVIIGSPASGSSNTTYTLVNRFRGSELVGKKYKPPFSYYFEDQSLKNRENGWKIYAADFVTTQEGTGVVHIAPAFGADDMELGKKENLPFIQHVGMDGTFKPEVTDFPGRSVKPKQDHQHTDVEIIKYLAHHDLLFSKKKIIHSYPFCWRCETPLLNYAASSWFVNVAEIRDAAIGANKKIDWIPSHLQEGRFGKGLETAPDWAVSRSRFWGSPLPVWKCTECNAAEIVGSLQDLEKKRYRTPNTYYLLRHGEREDIPQKNDHPDKFGPVVISADPNAPPHISEKGKEDIRKRAEELRQKGGVDAIFSSDFVRTKETAEIISEVLGVPVTYDEQLRELKHGAAFEGKHVEEYRNYFSSIEERFSKAPADGETLRDVRKRMMGFVGEFEKNNEEKRVLIISHGDPLWILESAFRTLSEEETVQAVNEYIKQGELRAFSLRNIPYDEEGRLNMHRPYSDSITLRCGACDGVMKRVPEVFDCWFESGSMPYGQHHYMGTPLPEFNPGKEKGFPADFIAEGLDQTRGWFYSLHILASALFESPAYRHVLVNGVILAEDGQKMSKRLKNYPDPMEMVGKYGADALRLYLLSSHVVYAEDLHFSEKGVEEISKKVMGRLANVYSFYQLYKASNNMQPVFDDSFHVLDQFILVELRDTLQTVEAAMGQYRVDRAVRTLVSFIDTFSTVYLQYSRDRLKEEPNEQKHAGLVFRYVLVEFSKVLAPFAPFFAEYAYREVRFSEDPESVHLADWPTLPKLPKGYEKTHADVEKGEVVIETILRMRSEAGVPVRQPLRSATVTDVPEREEVQNIICARVNIEALEKGPADSLDIEITSDLRERGMVRAFVRGVQDARKKEGLRPTDRIILFVASDSVENTFFEMHRGEIMRAVHADELKPVSDKGPYRIALEEGAVFVSMQLV